VWSSSESLILWTGLAGIGPWTVALLIGFTSFLFGRGFAVRGAAVMIGLWVSATTSVLEPVHRMLSEPAFIVVYFSWLLVATRNLGTCDDTLQPAVSTVGRSLADWSSTPGAPWAAGLSGLLCTIRLLAG
jgi:hypothetical protein